MFGGKKVAAAVSTSRFCQTPLELPYARLYRDDAFVVAVSQLVHLKGWPRGTAGSQEPTAYGLLHGSHTFPDHGVEEPLLPVEVTFGYSDPEQEGSGRALLTRPDDHTYLLCVHINDPEGTIFAAFGVAMERALMSGQRFKHLRCIKNRERSKPLRTDYQEQAKEDRAFLRRVDAGEVELEDIHFDRIIFTDEMTTTAPNWSHGFQDLEFHQPQFHSEATANWRQRWLANRLKSDEREKFGVE